MVFLGAARGATGMSPSMFRTSTSLPATSCTPFRNCPCPPPRLSSRSTAILSHCRHQPRPPAPEPHPPLTCHHATVGPTPTLTSRTATRSARAAARWPPSCASSAPLSSPAHSSADTTPPGSSPPPAVWGVEGWAGVEGAGRDGVERCGTEATEFRSVWRGEDRLLTV